MFPGIILENPYDLTDPIVMPLVVRIGLVGDVDSYFVPDFEPSHCC